MPPPTPAVALPLALGVALSLAACASPGGPATVGARTSTLDGSGVTHYDVDGATVAEVARSLQSQGQHGFGAWTRWELRWDYRVDGITGEGCGLTRFETDLDVQTTLPRLVNAGAKDPALRDEWARFSRALRQHEDGHAAIGVDAAAEMERRVRALSATSGTCRSLGNQIESLCREILDKHRARDRVYDMETRHGSTQGAVFGH